MFEPYVFKKNLPFILYKQPLTYPQENDKNKPYIKQEFVKVYNIWKDPQHQ